MSGIPAWARPGAKVVCVDDECFPFDQGETLPVEGSTYTIRETTRSERGTAQVRLVEVVNPSLDYELIAGPVTCECWFGLRRFRPLITRSQEDDLAIFRPILDTVPEHV